MTDRPVDPQISRPRPVPGGVCPRVLHGIDVDAGGNAYLCCITCTDTCATSLRLGNAFDEGLRAVVEGEGARRARAGHYSGDLAGLCCAHCESATPPEPGAAPPAAPADWLWFLELELTPRCNLSCRMCVHTFRAWEGQPLHEGVERGADVDPGRFRDLVTRFHQLHDGPKEVRLQWLGEPLLHPEWATLLRHACADPRTAGVLITNGVLLDRGASEAILETPGAIRVELSINAASPESYREVTGADGYETVVANVRRFLELRRRADRETDVAVRIKTLAMPETAGEVGAFLDLWRGELDRLGCEHATWWDNQGPAAPTVLCVNSLFAGGFAPADDLLDRARGHRGSADRSAQLFAAAHLERSVEHRPAREIREHSLAPLEVFLSETGAGDLPLLDVQALGLELREAAEAGASEGIVGRAAGRFAAGLERLLADGGLASADEWRHLSVLTRGLHRCLADRGYGRGGARQSDLEGAIVLLIAAAAGRFPGTARDTFLPLLRDVLLPSAAFPADGALLSARATAVASFLEGTPSRDSGAAERAHWSAAARLAFAGAAGESLQTLGEDAEAFARVTIDLSAGLDDANGWLDAQRIFLATIHAVPGFAHPDALAERVPLDVASLALLQRAVDLPGIRLAPEVVTLVRAAVLPVAGLRSVTGRTRETAAVLNMLTEAWGAESGAVVPLLSPLFRARAAVRRRPSVQYVTRTLRELREAIQSGATAGLSRRVSPEPRGARRDKPAVAPEIVAMVLPLAERLPSAERWDEARRELGAIRALLGLEPGAQDVFGLLPMKPDVRFDGEATCVPRRIRVTAGEPLSIGVPYAIPVGRSRPQIGVAVIDATGRVIHGPNTTTLGVDTAGIPREGVAWFETPANRLQPGTYRVAAGLFDHAGDRCWMFAPRLAALEIG